MTFRDLGGPQDGGFSDEFAYIPGELDLQVRVEGNPFCFSYSIEPTATTWNPSSPVSTMASASGFKSLGLAASGVQTLGEVAASVNRFWEQCEKPPLDAWILQAGLLECEPGKRNALSAGPGGAQLPPCDTNLDYATASVRLRTARDQIVAGVQDGQKQEAAAKFDAEATKLLDSIRIANFLSRQRLTTVRRRYGVGKEVSVTVTRTPLDRGALKKDSPSTKFDGPVFRTLAPIRFDVSLGPAIAWDTKNEYSYGVFEAEAGQQLRVQGSNEPLKLDGLVSISPYWSPRWLDGKITSWEFMIPRPMIGLSLSEPLTSVYLGLQVDPYQFVDLSVGLRLFAQTELASQQEGDPAFLDAEGAPQPLATEKELGASLFVAVSASTDLFVKWVSSL